MVEINLSAFCEIINRPLDIQLSGVTEVPKILYNFYSYNEGQYKQNEFYRLVVDDETNDEDIERINRLPSLARYGISLTPVSNIKRLYIFISNSHDTSSAIVKEFEQFKINNDISFIDAPDEIIVRKIFSDYEELEYSRKLFTELFPYTLYLNADTVLYEQYKEKTSKVDLLKRLQGYDILDISDNVRRISEYSKDSTVNFLYLFKKEIDAITQLIKSNSILICDESLSGRDFVSIMAFMFLYRNTKCYIRSGLHRRDYMYLVSKSFYATHYLVEDRINYIKNLPDAFIQYNGTVFSLCIKKSNTCKIRIAYDTIRNIQNGEVDLKEKHYSCDDIQLLPLSSLVNFNFSVDLQSHEDRQIFTKLNQECIKYIATLEQAKSQDHNPITYQRLVYFVENNEECLGYLIDSIHNELRTVTWLLMEGSNILDYKWHTADFESFLPLDIFVDAEDVKSKLNPLANKLNLNINTSNLSFTSMLTEDAFILNRYTESSTSFSNTRFINVFDYCMNCHETHYSKEFVHKLIDSGMSLVNLRREPEPFISSFGGPLRRLLTGELRLNERHYYSNLKLEE